MEEKELSIIDNIEYQEWFQHLCDEIDKQRLKAIMQLNAATLQHYWWLGNDIIHKQKEQGWGAKVIDQLSEDLQKRYSNDSGYSIRNLKYMKQFAEEYPDFPFVQVPLAQLREMPILQARLAKFTVSADGNRIESGGF
jgi:predicted nuclease of restriction endonuclease-like (RecB) superfamily